MIWILIICTGLTGAPKCDALPEIFVTEAACKIEADKRSVEPICMPLI